MKVHRSKQIGPFTASPSGSGPTTPLGAGHVGWTHGDAWPLSDSSYRAPRWCRSRAPSGQFLSGDAGFNPRASDTGHRGPGRAVLDPAILLGVGSPPEPDVTANTGPVQWDGHPILQRHVPDGCHGHWLAADRVTGYTGHRTPPGYRASLDHPVSPRGGIVDHVRAVK